MCEEHIHITQELADLFRRKAAEYEEEGDAEESLGNTHTAMYCGGWHSALLWAAVECLSANSKSEEHS